MTVSSTTTKNSYSGDGSNAVFAYTFKVFDEDDLTVILRTDATGTETVQTITTNYTVSGVGDAGGGNVTFVTPPASGVTVVIRRAAAITQTTDYTPNDPFPAEEHENALDKLTFIAQQQQEELDRAIKLSRTNTMTSTEFTVGSSDRANKILAFDGTGELSVTQELGVFRGDWAADTAFAVRDLIKDTTNDNIYICQTAHTSSGSLPISTNTDSSKWELIVDAATATTSATAAAASAAAAATSETNAAASATAAAGSEAGVAADAAAAEAAKLAAQAAQAAAETAETNAETAETNAETAETNAATSASAASTSASSAASSATVATTKAAEASTSATSAASSASSAATSESNASTSASNAASSATAAASSASSASSAQTAAEAARDSIQQFYLGAQASNPTVDGNGDPVTAGDWYFNTGDNTTRIYDGSAWNTVSPDLVGDTTPQLGGDLDLNGNDITGTGNVDITGTLTADGVTATGTLTVGDGHTIGDDTNDDLLITASTNENITLNSGAGIIRLKNQGTTAIQALNRDISFYDNTGTTQGFFWDASTQNLGLGTTSPSGKIEVSSSGDPDIYFSNIGSTAGNRSVNVRYNFSDGVGYRTEAFRASGDANTDVYLRFVNGSGSEVMRLDSSGNVGIGTTSPNQKLSVGGSASGTVALQVTNSTAGTAFNDGMQMFINDTAGGLNMREAYPLQFYVNGSERMRIDSSGNLLVGKTAAGFANTGHQLNGGGSYAAFTRDNATPVLVNRKSSDGILVEYMKDGTTVGSISTEGSRLAIGTGDVGLKFDSGLNQLMPFNISSNAVNDDVVTLGRSTSRFKNLYLSGGVYLGGTGSANLLDDYEEGTWTPVGATSSGTAATFGSVVGTYVKIGNLVTVNGEVRDVDTTGTTASSQFRISGLPFTPTSEEYQGSASTNTVTFQGSRTCIQSLINQVSGVLVFFVAGSGLSRTAVDHSDITSGTSDFFFTIQYQTF